MATTSDDPRPAPAEEPIEVDLEASDGDDAVKGGGTKGSDVKKPAPYRAY